LDEALMASAAVRRIAAEFGVVVASQARLEVSGREARAAGGHAHVSRLCAQ
jgi:hypothetical protein